MENTVVELSYALDTLYFLVMGAFVMWMAGSQCLNLVLSELKTQQKSLQKI